MPATKIEHEAFVYKWIDLQEDKYYIGFHIGSENDAYITSSKSVNEAYNKRPETFKKEVIAYGNKRDMLAFETGYLRAVDARRSDQYYNKWNNEAYFSYAMPSNGEDRMELKGKLEFADVVETNKEWFRVTIDGIEAHCDPSYLTDDEDERIAELVGKDVILSITPRGKYNYFNPNTLGEKNDNKN